MKIIKLHQNKNCIKLPWFIVSYKKNINPLKDVKQEKNPLNIIFSFEKFNFFAITKPKKNDPIIETIKLLFKITLKKVAT